MLLTDGWSRRLGERSPHRDDELEPGGDQEQTARPGGDEDFVGDCRRLWAARRASAAPPLTSGVDLSGACPEVVRAPCAIENRMMTENVTTMTLPGRALLDHLHPRRADAGSGHRRDHHADLPDVDLRAGRARPAQGLRVRADAEPDARGARSNIAAIEGGTGAFAYASGMAAIGAIASLLTPGDHVVVTDNTYGGTFRLFDRVLTKYGLEFTYVDTSQPDADRAGRSSGHQDAVRRDAHQPGDAADRPRRRRGDRRTRTTFGSSSTTPSRAPSSSGRSRSAPTWWCTARRNT